MKVHYNLENALQRLKRLDEAMEHCNAVLRMQPDYVDAYNNMGVVLYIKGDINGAIGYFQMAFQIDPNDIQIKSNLEQLLIMQKQKQR
jgi:tetratricopeptide (TPR) repeat protein